MTRLTRFVVCATALFLGATRVSADPVRVTSGSLVATNESLFARLSIAGTQGFSVDAFADRLEGRMDAFNLCNRCPPGSAVSLGAFLGDGAISGAVTFGGRAFLLGFSIDQPTVLALEFSGMTIVPLDDRGPVTMRAPFTLTGALLLSFGAERVPLSGSGTASLFVNPTHLDAPEFPLSWEIEQLRYDFESTAATPEPATLTLLSIGILAGGLGRRGRRRT